MLQSIQRLCKARIGSSDGEIGPVNDCFFDDRSWAVRYLVADTNTWMPGRLVLIAPTACCKLSHGGKILKTELTRKQVEQGPALDSRHPVSREYEENCHQYYGWPMYWQQESPANVEAPAAIPMRLSHSSGGAPAGTESDCRTRASQLLSAKTITGYRIIAVDEEIGHVTDVILDDRSWAVQHIVLDTRDRLPGKKLMIEPTHVDRISQEDSAVYLNITKVAMFRSSWCA